MTREQPPEIEGAPVPAVILSGGAEIVSVSLAEVFVAQGIPLAVVGLGRRSLIRDVAPDVVYRQLDWPPRSLAAASEQLSRILDDIGAGTPRPWPVFATEDGGLRLLFEAREILEPRLAMGGARALPMRGLDKAEAFEILAARGLGDLLAPWVAVERIDDVPAVLDRLGDDAVFKPALRPLAFLPHATAARVITAAPGESRVAVVERLREAWSLSGTWVAQARLHTPPDGEALWWGVRDAGGRCVGTTGCERWKFPRMGGTGCWVETREIGEIGALVPRILDAIDLRGLAELAFLRNGENHWRLVEINPRAMLQIGLPERAGLSLVHAAYLDLLGLPVPEPGRPVEGTSWVNAERMLLSAWSGAYGPRAQALATALGVVRRSHCRVVYDTPLRRVRARWIGRMLRRLGGR